MIKRKPIEQLLEENAGRVPAAPSAIPDMTVIGIDPGTNVMGYAVVKVENSSMSVQGMGVIQLASVKDPYGKLSMIFRQVGALIDRYRPSEMALEAPFYGKNVQSMLKLGRAQGVAMAAGLSRGLRISEYPPRRVKQAVTGQGEATKEKVATLLSGIFSEDFSDQKLDATDALAVAVAHVTGGATVVGSLKAGRQRHHSGWEQFMKDNQDRVVE